MLFTSYQFIVFLMVVVFVFYCAPKKWQTLILLLASYLFYYFAARGCLIYVILTTIGSYFAARGISKASGKQRKSYKRLKKIWLIMGLIFTLGLLGVFKYTNFFIYNVNRFVELLDETKQINYIRILLPLGISFYTFRCVGYLVDIYRGKFEAEKNIVRYALFVSFFPQIIQGPISRYDELGRSLFLQKKFNKQVICSGLQRMLWGYFKKLVIADRILIAVNTVIRSPQEYQGAYVFLGALFYAVELYADFTGGMDITIGIGELFGVQIVENFRQPFLSKSVKEYWTRWHISMGTWFRNYVFYPCSVDSPMRKLTSLSKSHFGKKIGKKLPVYMASFIVWFLTGLWHGASWNFIVWGLGNFVLITLSEECRPMFAWFHKQFPHVKEKKWFSALQITRTILLMSCLRMFDCYKTVSETIQMFFSMFTKWDSRIFFDGSLLKLGISFTDYIIIFIGIILMFKVSLQQKQGPVREKIRSFSGVTRFCIWYGLFLVVILFGAYGIGYDETQFIYTQF